MIVSSFNCLYAFLFAGNECLKNRTNLLSSCIGPTYLYGYCIKS